MILEMEKI